MAALLSVPGEQRFPKVLQVVDLDCHLKGHSGAELHVYFLSILKVYESFSHVGSDRRILIF